MNKLRKNQSGFTLIELMVVVIIVAVLAAVAVPLMQGNINNARSSEAAAALGVIRTNLRTMLAQQGAYPDLLEGDLFITDPVTNVSTSKIPGIQINDLVGRYFDNNDFAIQESSTETDPATPAVGTYCIDCAQDIAAALPGAQIAPNAAQAATIRRSINENGNIYDARGCAAGGGAVLN